jgi:hypothetical protein
MTMIGFLLVSLTLIALIARVIAIRLALTDVPPKHRAEVLRGLAECFRSWKR